MNAKIILKSATVFLMLCFMAVPRAVATESQVLNAGWLLETARSTILSSSPWSDAGCNVEIDSVPSDFVLYRSGRVEVIGTLERTPNNIRDIGAVKVDVYIAGELYMVFDPSPYLTVTVSAFAVSHDIERGQVLTESDIEEVEIDVRSLPTSDMYGSIDEIVGLAARMNIQVGRILADGMLEPPTLVMRGESLIVYIPLGSATVTLQGIALDSGSAGEEIRVRNPDSSMIITAIVTGPSLATVYLLN